MNVLEQFYIDLDESCWDVNQESDIIQALQKVKETLVEEKQVHMQHLA